MPGWCGPRRRDAILYTQVSEDSRGLSQFVSEAVIAKVHGDQKLVDVISAASNPFSERLRGYPSARSRAGTTAGS